MPRSLRDLTQEERVTLIAAIHTEAEAAGWHGLNNAQKRVLYDRWAEEFDLARPAIKDGIMKGFDVPTIILFGNLSRKRWEEIRTTCLERLRSLGTSCPLKDMTRSTGC